MKIRNVFIDTIIRIVLSDIHVAEDYLRIWGTVAHLCQGPMRLPARPRATFEASPLLAGSPLLGGCGVSDAGSGHLINSCGRARDFSPVLVFFSGLENLFSGLEKVFSGLEKIWLYNEIHGYSVICQPFIAPRVTNHQ